MENFRDRQKKATILASIISKEEIKDLSRAAKFIPAVSDCLETHKLPLQDMFYVDFTGCGKF